MILDEDVTNFIEHFGKKGMRWGQRKAVSVGTKTGRIIRKNPSNKALNVGFGIVGALAARKILGGQGQLALFRTAAGAVAGKAVANKIIEKRGSTKVSQL